MVLFAVLLFLAFGHSLSLDLGSFDAAEEGTCAVDLSPHAEDGE